MTKSKSNEEEIMGHIFREIQNKTASLVRISTNPILQYFDQSVCDKIDSMSHCDLIIKDYQKNILADINAWKDDFCDAHKAALEKYNEASLYLALKLRGIDVSRIPESKHEKTPDFSVSSCVETFYIEQKSLGFAQGLNNYNEAMYESLDSNIQIEEQLKVKAIAQSEHIISPYGGVKNYDYSSRRMVIRVIGEKIGHNIKRDQFSKGKTHLFVNINQLPIFGDGKKSVCAEFVSRHRNLEIVSGILWHVCFGKIGDRIFSNAEFEGKPNIEGCLEREGALVGNDFIQSIVFWKNDGLEFEFYCLHNDAIDIPNEIRSFLTSENDEGNSHGFKYLEN